MRRRIAREIAVQCLYQMEMNDVSIEEAVGMILDEASDENEAGLALGDKPFTTEFIVDQVKGVDRHKQTIDDLLTTYLKGWKMDRLSRVDRQILRLAVFELLYSEETPPKAVINEAIELAKYFGTEDSGKFVNGVLGKMFKKLEQIKSELHVQNSSGS